MILLSEKNPVIRLFVTHQDRCEGLALTQLERAARLAGMEIAVALPDLHPGKGIPVGAAFAAKGRLYPHLVGNDVGCGMGFWQTTLKSAKCKPERWEKKLTDLEGPWAGNLMEWLSARDLTPSAADEALGTIGGGNHFAEIQAVDEITDPVAWERLGLSQKHLFILVHSGSRGLGDLLLRRHTERHGAAPLLEDSAEGIFYHESHDHAHRWAAANRALIARRVLDRLGSEGRLISDLSHNGVETVTVGGTPYLLHRKGVAPAGAGPVIVPGSRGTRTYLVQPVGDQSSNLWSIAHGAGRKWNRGSSKTRMKEKTHARALTRTKLGGVVICENRDLLFEEAPAVYKNIDRVIEEMKTEGLIEVIAAFRPVLTYKMRKTD